MTPEQRDRWLEERLTYVGASEVAQAAGLSPWGDPIALWAQKRGLEAGPDESFRMKFGTLVEPMIGQLYTDATGRRLRRTFGPPLDGVAGAYGPIRHPALPALGANPDFRIVGERGLVQAKSSDHADSWGDPDDGAGLGIPLHYRIQGWAELACTGLDFIDFAVLHGARSFGVYPLVRDEQAIEDLLADVAEFWQHVLDGTMPEPTALSGPALARRFRPALEVGKVANAAQERVLAELLAQREAVKLAVEREDELKSKAKALIGTAAFIEGAGHQFRWWRGESAKVAWRELAGAYRALLDRIAEAESAELASGGRTFIGLEDGDLIADPDTLVSLYTRTEPADRFTVVKSK